jgi:hypothetical protein
LFSKDKVIKSDLELKLKESVSDNLQTNYLTLTEEISKRTEYREDLLIIMNFIKKKLNSKKWQRILKVKLIFIYLQLILLF